MADQNSIETTAIVTVPSNDDKNLATITHLGGTVFSVFPALIVWVLKKDDNAYVGEQAKEALNFQITVLMAQFVAGLLMFILIGFVMLPLIWLANIIICIIAAIATSKGGTYRYPLTVRLIN